MDNKITTIQDLAARYIASRGRHVARPEIMLTGKELADLVKQFGAGIIGKEFNVDEYNVRTVKALVRYFAGKPGFESGEYCITHTEPDENDVPVPVLRRYPYSLGKGILLAGPTGTGKTDALSMFADISRFTRNGINMQFATCKNISEGFSVGGYPALRKYYKATPWMLDDLGDEVNGKHYSTSDDCIARILSERYNLWKLKKVPTFATTNLTGAMLYERYGERVYERICEMFNVFYLTGPSRRPQKGADVI